jgi:hypothetical protein
MVVRMAVMLGRIVPMMVVTMLVIVSRMWRMRAVFVRNAVARCRAGHVESLPVAVRVH